MSIIKSEIAAHATSLPGTLPLDPSWIGNGRAEQTVAPETFVRKVMPETPAEIEPAELKSLPATSRPEKKFQTCPHGAGQLSALFSAQDFITGHKFEVAHCVACGFAVTTPQPAPSEIGNYYPCGYYGALGDRRFPKVVEVLQEALYTHRVRKIEAALGKKGRVLDVGCGRGWLLKEFRRQGWEVQGTELSDSAATYARQVLNLPVETGSLDTIGFPANHFDAVTLWHVLEHVSDPRAILAEVNRVLKPGGVLLVSVPDFSGFEARFFRDKWFHLDVPRHVTHLTKDTLERALCGAGFDDGRWSGLAPEYDTFSFVQSALNWCGLRHNLLYDLLRGKGAKVIGTTRAPRWQIFATLVLGAVFGLLSLPATLLATALGQAATMTVISLKRAESTERAKPALDFIAPHPARLPADSPAIG
jgi:SAM-dependent methyltransferase